jgi:hypothetical protein
MLPPPLPPSSSTFDNSSDPPASSEEHIKSSPNPTTKLEVPEAKTAAKEDPRLTALNATYQSLLSERLALINSTPLPSGLPMPDDWTEAQKTEQALKSANERIKEHIDLLHRYNEIKDVAMGLLGLVAEKRGVRVKVLMEEFGIGEQD